MNHVHTFDLPGGGFGRMCAFVEFVGCSLDTCMHVGAGCGGRPRAGFAGRLRGVTARLEGVGGVWSVV